MHTILNENGSMICQNGYSVATNCDVNDLCQVDCMITDVTDIQSIVSGINIINNDGILDVSGLYTGQNGWRCILLCRKDGPLVSHLVVLKPTAELQRVTAGNRVYIMLWFGQDTEDEMYDKLSSTQPDVQLRNINSIIL